MALDGVETYGPGTSDERLAELSAAGHERAFAALVDRHQAPLRRFCRRVGVPVDDVDDVVQGTFASAWSALQEGTHVTAVRGWLYRIARHEAIDRHRRGGVAAEPLPETLAAPDGPGGELQADVAATLDGLRDLPDAQRRALIGTAVQGRSHHDLAEELGLSDTAVRGLVFRARAAMRTAVGGLVPAPLLALARRLGAAPELVAGGDAPAVAKVVAVTLSAGALAGGAGVAIHKAAGEPARHVAPPAHTVRHPAAAAPRAVPVPAPSGHRRAAASHRAAPATARRHAAPPAVVRRPASSLPSRGGPAPEVAPASSKPAPAAPGPAATAPAPADGGGHGADDPAPSSGGHGADDPVAAVPDDHGGATTTTTPVSAPAPADDAAAAQAPAADDHGGRG